MTGPGRPLDLVWLNKSAAVNRAEVAELHAAIGAWLRDTAALDAEGAACATP